jgi:hypothetical protein
MHSDPGILDRIVAFLDGIGIPIVEGEVPAESFLPGVRIVRGGIVFDPATLRWPGDLLHEAGHIAITPSAQRAALDDAMDDLPSAEHAGEVEATAWAYAAVVHLQLDPSVLFHDGGYHGHSRGLIQAYMLGVYPGAAGLAQAGMTQVGVAAIAAGIPPYPHMLRWSRA